MRPSPQSINTWEIPDCLWEKIEPVLLAADPPKATGRKRVDQRRILNGIVFKFHSGCQWNSMPKELGDDSTIHRTFQRWERLGVFAQVWDLLMEEMEYPGSVAGDWPVINRAKGKSEYGVKPAAVTGPPAR